MKTLLPLVALLLTGSLSAQCIVILDKTNFGLVDSVTAARPARPDQTTFIEGVRKDLAQPPAFEEARALENPPAWGRTVHPDSRGILRYHAWFSHGFVCRLTLKNLLPDHRYILTLNGNPDRAGNDLLPDPVPGKAREKYYDFLTVTTDSQGRYEATLAVFLPPGAYAVRFFVKDTDDFKIVLYRDFFKFTVDSV